MNDMLALERKHLNRWKKGSSTGCLSLNALLEIFHIGEYQDWLTVVFWLAMFLGTTCII